MKNNKENNKLIPILIFIAIIYIIVKPIFSMSSNKRNDGTWP